MEITVEQYQDAIQNALSPKQIEVLQALYNFPNSTATAKELAAKLNYASYHPANRQIGSIGETIAKHNNIDILEHYYYIDRGEKKPSYFYVVGPYNKKSGWKMWDNLRTALKNPKIIEAITPKYYIQYHNADKLGRYPSSSIDINTSVDLLTLDNSIKYEQQIFTSKKLVEKAVGQFCFLIVGKTEEIKKYYLWSYFKIENVDKRDSDYSVKGVGYSFEKPILLNELEHFEDFKNFCGNFGIGFQNIDKHPFCQTLVAFSSGRNLENPNPVEKTDNNIYLEGSSSNALHIKYERNQEARTKCVEHYRMKNDGQLLCAVCDFNFEKTYGELGKDFIHVHHLTPVSEIGENYQIDPIADLMPVCPNCHSMIHRKRQETVTIDKLKSLIKASK